MQQKQNKEDDDNYLEHKKYGKPEIPARIQTKSKRKT